MCSNHSIYIIVLFIFELVPSLCDFILCLLYIFFSNQFPELTPVELLCYTSTDFYVHHLPVAVLILLVAGCGCLIIASDSGTYLSTQRWRWILHFWISCNCILGSLRFCGTNILSAIWCPSLHLVSHKTKFTDLIHFIFVQTNTQSPLIFLSDRTSHLCPAIYICIKGHIYMPHTLYPD